MLGVATHFANPWLRFFRSARHGFVSFNAAEVFLEYFIISLELVHISCQFFLFHTFRFNVSAAANLKQLSVQVGPSFNTFKIIRSWDGKLFSKLNFLRFFIKFKETLGNNSSGMENTGELCTNKVTFLAREGRVRINGCVKVTSDHMLNHARADDVLGANVGQLDPVREKIVSDPVYEGVSSLTAGLLISGLIHFVTAGQGAGADPIVLLRAEELGNKAKTIGT